MKLFVSIMILAFAFTTYSFGETKVQKNELSKDQGFRLKWDAKKKTGVCVNKEGIPGYNPHFIGPCGDLRGLKLSGIDLNGADLEGANLDGLNLTGVRFNGALLKGVHARGANFSKTHLNGAFMVGGNFSGATFDRAEMNGVHLNFANLSGSRFNHVQLHGARFENANLQGVKFRSEMKTARLNNATYSVGTQLPFATKIAGQRGMTFISYQVPPDFQRTPAQTKGNVESE